MGVRRLFACVLLTCFVLALNSTASDHVPTQNQRVQKMDGFVRSHDFSGVVLVARNGHVLFQKAYGLANREHGVANKLDTKFRLGSITKQFTALAVMILSEHGKLKVSDPICKYVENCPSAWSAITVHHLLTHTSGIPDFTDFPDNDHYDRLPMTPLETMARFRDKPLEFVPGERFNYDNSGYLVLGYIIERASGEKYEDFLRKNIYEPLGMLHSGYDHPWIVLKDRASGYARRGREIVNAEYTEMDQPLGGGSMYSTVGDLLRWDQALYTEKLVSQRSLDQIFTPNETVYSATRPLDRGWYSRHKYGYGWDVTQQWFGRKLYSHSGGINGFRSMIMRYPEDRTLVVVLTNMELPEVEDGDLTEERAIIANGLSAITFGLSPNSTPVSGKTSETTHANPGPNFTSLNSNDDENALMELEREWAKSTADPDQIARFIEENVMPDYRYTSSYGSVMTKVELIESSRNDRAGIATATDMQSRIMGTPEW